MVVRARLVSWDALAAAVVHVREASLGSPSAEGPPCGPRAPGQRYKPLRHDRTRHPSPEDAGRVVRCPLASRGSISPWPGGDLDQLEQLGDRRPALAARERVLLENLRELSGPGWDEYCRFQYEPTSNHPDIESRWANARNVSDVHPSVHGEENPEGIVMRIIASGEYDDWVRVTEHHWSYQQALETEMDEGVRDELCDPLRNNGPLKNKHGTQALLVDAGGWVRFYEVAEFLNITPIALVWEVCCDRTGLFQLVTCTDDEHGEDKYRHLPPSSLSVWGDAESSFGRRGASSLAYATRPLWARRRLLGRAFSQ